ncbi:unnamed protein product, partial [Clonostachys chloroleuca]
AKSKAERFNERFHQQLQSKLFQLWGLLRRNYQATLNPPVANKSTEPLRFGILGAAVIAPQSHLGIVTNTLQPKPIALILPAKSHPEVVVQAIAARDNAFKHSIPDALKAIKAGKQILLEKPSVSNAREAKNLFNSPLLKEPNSPVLLEAFHFSAKVVGFIPALFISVKDNIRFNYDLAGGGLIDFGCYAVCAL